MLKKLMPMPSPKRRAKKMCKLHYQFKSLAKEMEEAFEDLEPDIVEEIIHEALEQTRKKL